MLKLVKPTKDYEEQALECVNEYYMYNSEINGSGGLDRYLADYDEWLKKLEVDRNRSITEESVPGETYFLVRKEDDKIIGFVNIRLAMNNRVRNEIGHIGYSIRPTERRKGYNKINLYLALKICMENNIEYALLFCYKSNPGSRKTMEALGGKFVEEFESSEKNGEIEQKYMIDVKDSLEKYKDLYEQEGNINRDGICLE